MFELRRKTDEEIYIAAFYNANDQGGYKRASKHPSQYSRRSVGLSNGHVGASVPDSLHGPHQLRVQLTQVCLVQPHPTVRRLTASQTQSEPVTVRLTQVCLVQPHPTVRRLTARQTDSEPVTVHLTQIRSTTGTTRQMELSE